MDALGNNFDTASNGFIDVLLLDEQSFPLVVLEVKAEDINPLIGKEQARKYARSQNCRFVNLISEEANTLAKYLDRARDAGLATTKVVLLRDGFDAAWFEIGQTRLVP